MKFQTRMLMIGLAAITLSGCVEDDMYLTDTSQTQVTYTNVRPGDTVYTTRHAHRTRYETVVTPVQPTRIYERTYYSQPARGSISTAPPAPVAYAPAPSISTAPPAPSVADISTAPPAPPAAAEPTPAPQTASISTAPAAPDVAPVVAVKEKNPEVSEAPAAPDAPSSDASTAPAAP